MNRTRKLIATARDFLRCKRGNIAMIFGVALVPIMIGAGAGLDFARAMMVRQQMAEALDAAALAVGSTPGLDATKAQDMATKFFNANYTVNTTQYGTVAIAATAYDAKGSITLTASNTMPTVLMRLININDIKLSTNSTVVWGQTKLWVALVLDNSGSMCDPVTSVGPCKNTTVTTTKIWQLKDATKTMITSLQAVSATPGDVRVAIVPFTRDVDVGIGNVSASWIDWSYWEAAPANSGITATPDATGPGSNCPFSNKGYSCLATSANNASTTGTIPSSGAFKGMICPGYDSGSANTDHEERYYNGCYDSVPTQTKTDTKTDSKPTTLTQTCTQVGAGAVSCNAGSSSTGSTTSNTTTATTAGWTGDSTTSSNSSSAAPPVDGAHNCVTKKGVTTCTWTRTTVTTAVTTTVTAIGVGPWRHNWIVNSHSTWGGCVTDRTQNLDVGNGSVSASFPAVNPRFVYNGTRLVPADYSGPDYCMAGKVTPMEYDWSDLTTKIDAMQAAGKTNQAIGVAHGWQALTPNGAYGAPALPANTTRYIILFSDGLNTQNHWGSVPSDIDARMKLACDHAKADQVVIYTMYVHVAGDPPNSAPLQDCASDSSKYYNVAGASQIAAAFADITKKITNVRVSM